MSAKLTEEMRQALLQSGGKPVEVEDVQTKKRYVIIDRDEFRDMQHRVVHYDELSGDEMLTAAAQALDDPEGWGAPGMEEYDQDGNESKP